MISDKNTGLRIFILLTTLLAASCTSDFSGGKYYTVAGFTQGTTYHVTYHSGDSLDLSFQIDSLLAVFDSSLSAYLPGSIISSINDNRDEPVTDTLFRTVFREAKRIHELTGGAFDITVGPLIDAWGFGPGEKMNVDSSVIDSLLQFVGMDKVKLVNNRIEKSHPGMRLDVNAIAQGYAVDFLSAYLEGRGIRDYMVEVGGEVRTRGLNPRGRLWGIGIDRPEFGNYLPGNHLEVIIRMSGRSLATSGNYRKFFEKDGIKYHHSVDPATGYPKQDRLLSATILAGSCMTADALATACMVMGLDRARSFITELDGVDAFFIFNDEAGIYRVWHTPGLRKYLENP
ncbi:MAG: FAD:protein FMN transferase [Bacteroidales bacterium]|nr:FAD:protein FMN transferase [Bacteroidales bacterium]